MDHATIIESFAKRLPKKEEKGITALPLINRFFSKSDLDKLYLQQENATSYNEWYNISLELDKLLGNDVWKSTIHSDLYDYKLILSYIEQMQSARLSSNYKLLLYIIRTTWVRNIGNIGNLSLYRHSHVGTKLLIDEYINECKLSLDYLVTNHSHDRYLLGMLIQTRKNIGRTALLLSGGSTFGIFHVGVLVTLLENSLLPRIISGSLAGSIMAAIICCRLNEETLELLRDVEGLKFNIFGDDGSSDDVSETDKSSKSSQGTKHDTNSNFCTGYNKGSMSVDDNTNIRNNYFNGKVDTNLESNTNNSSRKLSLRDPDFVSMSPSILRIEKNGRRSRKGSISGIDLKLNQPNYLNGDSGVQLDKDLDSHIDGVSGSTDINEDIKTLKPQGRFTRFKLFGNKTETESEKDNTKASESQPESDTSDTKPKPSSKSSTFKGLLLIFAHFIKYGTLYNTAGLKETMMKFSGDLTFREAYNRTGKILNITVSTASIHEQTRLLNYLTAPNCLIWSAVLASCSLPGVFPSTTIFEKGVNGSIKEWNNDMSSKYLDGSVDNDLPIARLSEMFNVDHIIAVQVNPHVAPILKVSVSDVGMNDTTWIKGLLSNVYDFVSCEMVHYLSIFNEMDIQKNLSNKLISILSQNYSGDITILPSYHASDFLNIFQNPTPAFLVDFIVRGAKACWPKITLINNHCGIEFALDKAITTLRGKLISNSLKSKKNSSTPVKTGNSISTPSSIVRRNTTANSGRLKEKKLSFNKKTMETLLNPESIVDDKEIKHNESNRKQSLAEIMKQDNQNRGELVKHSDNDSLESDADSEVSKEFSSIDANALLSNDGDIDKIANLKNSTDDGNYENEESDESDGNDCNRNFLGRNSISASASYNGLHEVAYKGRRGSTSIIPSISNDQNKFSSSSPFINNNQERSIKKSNSSSSFTNGYENEFDYDESSNKLKGRSTASLLNYGENNYNSKKGFKVLSKSIRKAKSSTSFTKAVDWNQDTPKKQTDYPSNRVPDFSNPYTDEQSIKPKPSATLPCVSKFKNSYIGLNRLKENFQKSNNGSSYNLQGYNQIDASDLINKLNDPNFKKTKNLNNRMFNAHDTEPVEDDDVTVVDFDGTNADVEMDDAEDVDGYFDTNSNLNEKELREEMDQGNGSSVKVKVDGVSDDEA